VDAQIKEVEKDHPELAAKLRSAWQAHVAEHDGVKQQLATLAKMAKAVEKERDAFKGDLDARVKGDGEATTKLTKERDAVKAELEAERGARLDDRKRAAVERKLAAIGVTDEAKVDYASTAVLTKHGAEITLDDKGALVGVDKAVESVRKALFGEPDKGAEKKAPAGPRAGSGAAPAKGTDKGSEESDEAWANRAFGPKREAK